MHIRIVSYACSCSSEEPNTTYSDEPNTTYSVEPNTTYLYVIP